MFLLRDYHPIGAHLLLPILLSLTVLAPPFFMKLSSCHFSTSLGHPPQHLSSAHSSLVSLSSLSHSFFRLYLTRVSPSIPWLPSLPIASLLPNLCLQPWLPLLGSRPVPPTAFPRHPNAVVPTRNQGIILNFFSYRPPTPSP